MSAAQPVRLVAVVDCGLGNIHSLLGCLRRLTSVDRIEYTADAELIKQADCVLLPGDGSFGACVAEIDARGLREILVEAATSKPFFGICVGMQVLFEASEEGEGAGLGVLAGTVKRFPAAADAKVPLMGWLDVQQIAEHSLLVNASATRYYFLHSFHVSDRVASTVLAGRYTADFAAAVAQDKLFATQFHPEKSAVAGVSLLERFLAAVPVPT